jgi:hypothetical protein
MLLSPPLSPSHRFFTDEMDGKEYGLNMMHLIRKSSDASKDSYFCSEIVAMAYKRVGLLPPNLSSNSYLPNAFSEDGKMQLLGDASFGEEILIVFNTPAVKSAVPIY